MAGYLSVALIKKVRFVLQETSNKKFIDVYLFVNKMSEETVIRSIGHHVCPTLEFSFPKILDRYDYLYITLTLLFHSSVNSSRRY